MNHLAAQILIAIILLSLSAPVDVAIADETAATLKALQGKWIRRQKSNHGPLTIVKEHKGKTTTLTIYDADEKVLYSHTSEFKIERSGRTLIFTFFNRKITVGRKKPDDGKAVSFVFRVVNDRFIEVYGVLEGDTNAPNMIVWERMKVNNQGKDAV